MWLVVLSMPSFTLILTYNILFDFQNNGDAMKKISNAFTEIQHASTHHSFVMATSNVLMAVTKDLVVG